MSPLYLFLMVTLTTTTSIGVSTDVIFGYCESENQTCADCYYKLKESLLQRDKNIQNLSLAFFPPNKNIPEFVAVTYCFNENCTNPEKWFWTHDSSYLFFPIETFQYLSMFFGKPASLFSQKLFVTLDAECNNTDHNLMKLLTQRVSCNTYSNVCTWGQCLLYHHRVGRLSRDASDCLYVILTK